MCGRAVGIKWPNDLVVPGDDGPDRKLAGILAEASWPPGVDIASGWRSAARPAGSPWSWAWASTCAPQGGTRSWRASAVACDELAAPDVVVTREALVGAWLRALEHWYAQVVDPAGREPMWAAWRERSATLGRRVRVDLGTDDLEGEAIDVTPGGQLVVRTLEGDTRVLAVGDVTHLRPL